MEKNFSELTCPYCGGNIEIREPSPQQKCSYCGQYAVLTGSIWKGFQKAAEETELIAKENAIKTILDEEMELFREEKSSAHSWHENRIKHFALDVIQTFVLFLGLAAVFLAFLRITVQ